MNYTENQNRKVLNKVMEVNKIICGNCLDVMKTFPDESIHCCITSPPYWGLRNYNCDGQLGLEKTPEEYVKKMVEVFGEVKRVLRKDGTLWLNLGSNYAGSGGAHKEHHANPGLSKSFERDGVSHDTSPSRNVKFKSKDLVPIPWMVAMALQADGWWLRQDIIWSKPNPMPESVTDRCTKSHEYIFLLSKSVKYYYDNESIREPAGIRGNANSFRGGAYCDGNKDNALLGKRTVSGNTKIKIPAGWDTGKGSHGSFHREGRGNPAYSFARKTATQGKPGSQDQHRENREDIQYIETRNKRSVWTVATYPFKKAHFATFPPKLIEPCILAGCPKDGIVIDPFMGAGTVGFVAKENNRNYIGIELNPDYIKIANQRISQAQPQFDF